MIVNHCGIMWCGMLVVGIDKMYIFGVEMGGIFWGVFWGNL